MVRAVNIYPKSSVAGLAALIVVSNFWFVDAGRAQGAASCSRATLGQVTCMSVKLCECIYERGGTMTGVPAGYRWDCGTLRPQCEESPVTVIEHRGTTPSYSGSVSFDQYDQSVTVDQDGTNTNTNQDGTNTNQGGTNNTSTNTSN